MPIWNWHDRPVWRTTQAGPRPMPMPEQRKPVLIVTQPDRSDSRKNRPMFQNTNALRDPACRSLELRPIVKRQSGTVQLCIRGFSGSFAAENVLGICGNVFYHLLDQLSVCCERSWFVAARRVLILTIIHGHTPTKNAARNSNDRSIDGVDFSQFTGNCFAESSSGFASSTSESRSPVFAATGPLDRWSRRTP